MIEFYGEYSDECKLDIAKRRAKTEGFLFLIVSIIASSSCIVYGIFHQKLVYAIVLTVLFSVVTVGAFVTPSKRVLHFSFPTRLVVNEDKIFLQTLGGEKIKPIHKVKKVIDVGEWYIIIFKFGDITNSWICQKDLIINGEIDDFIKLFKDKIVYEKNKDIEKGKEIFFKYNGSIMHIEREMGAEYKKCGVPKELEKKWLDEIIKSLRNELCNSKGNDRIVLINSYIQLLNANEATEFLIDFLSKTELDTFSLLIICETLKQYSEKDISLILKNKVSCELSVLKENMLKNKISVDSSFKELSYMKDYDFSDNSIIERIKDL